MIMEAVKRNVCRGVIFLMACLTCVVVFGSGLIAKATNYSPYAPYTTYTGSLDIYGSKTLTGREFRDGDEFTFKIVADSNNPTVVEGAGELLKEVTIHPTEDQEQFDFDAELTFEEPGKYIYYISEVKPEESLANIIYDQTIYRLTVNVEVDAEDDAGNEPGGQGGSDGKAEAQTGSETSDSDRMEGDSMADESNGGITGRTSPAGNDASQTGEEESPPAGASEDPCSGDGAILNVSANSSADVMRSGGEYAGEGRDDGQKQLKVAGVKIEKSTDQCQTWVGVEGNGPICAFINQYISASVPLTGTKTLTGREFRSGDTFTFTITPENDTPVPVDDNGNPLTEVTIQPTSGNSAEIDFGTLYFNPDDLDEGKEKTFTYTITEKQGNIDGMSYDTASRTVQIQVTAQEDGSMTAEVVSPVDGSLLWTNTWEGPGEPGGDPGDDSGDDPRPSYTSLTVNKEWILDDGGEAPVSVTVELLRNNRVHEEVTLDEDNDWSHTWTRLDDRYNWKVQEADVPDGFTAEVSHRGTIWTITNDDIPEDPETPPEEPDEPDEPDTPEEPDTPDEPGTPDEPDIPDEPGTPGGPDTPDEPTLPQTGQSWWPVWALAIAGAILMLAGILVKKRYHGKHEA